MASHGAAMPADDARPMSEGGGPDGRTTADAARETAGQPASEPILVGRDLCKSYHSGDGSELVVLDGVRIDVRPGEVVAVVGASGAGKSTLLHLLGGLDRPTTGTVVLDGAALEALEEAELAGIRNRKLGFVFQFHHLLREFTALENVMMPLLISGTDGTEARDQAHDLLDAVGLGQRATHKPSQLSGGEQQRVAVARALANRPVVLLADEPSGNLDTATSERLHDLFFRLRDERQVAMILATHNRELADRADRVLRLQNGQLENLYRA